MTLLTKNFLRPAIATALILLIPLVAMQFTAEVNWSLSDFVVMGALIFCTGLAFEVVMSRGGNIAYRIAFGLAIPLTLFLIWANLAVGLVGSGANLPNLLFGLVPFVGVIGAIIARLRPHGMARTMYAMATAIALVPLIGLAVNKPELDMGVVEALGITAAFALLFVASGLLFRHAAMYSKPAVA